MNDTVLDLPAIRDGAPGTATPLTPMAMLSQAVSSGAGIETIAKLMDLQERWQAAQARKAFDEAIAAAKAKIPVVQKNATGHNDKRYANFAAYAQVIDPILSEFGLSYRFRSQQDDRIHVTCILSHKDGHYEETTLGGPSDTTGGKNAIQAIGSTLTYLQRYTLVQALGLAASDDDDGRAAGRSGDPITDEQAQEIRSLIDNTGTDIERFCRFYRVDAIPELTAAQFVKAKAQLEAKRGAK